ncbi:hypothetical protein ARTHRO8AJ_90027 [Arthrobacter sp. 8AJ]|nr:hypothetical protein ARTHRO8AJ_90027 [Arthrobacter sp. 8AJ]
MVPHALLLRTYQWSSYGQPLASSVSHCAQRRSAALSPLDIHGRGAMMGNSARLLISHAAHQLKEELLMIIPSPWDIALMVFSVDRLEFESKKLTFPRCDNSERAISGSSEKTIDRFEFETLLIRSRPRSK